MKAPVVLTRLYSVLDGLLAFAFLAWAIGMWTCIVVKCLIWGIHS